MARVSGRSNEAHLLMELVLSVSWDSHGSQVGLPIVDLVTVGPPYCILLLRGNRKSPESLGWILVRFLSEDLFLLLWPLYHSWLGTGIGTATGISLYCAGHQVQNRSTGFGQGQVWSKSPIQSASVVLRRVVSSCVCSGLLPAKLTCQDMTRMR